jgi:hypothetical protein
MSWRLILLVVLTSALALSQWVAGCDVASAQRTITISGRVVNGTAGSSVPSGLPVRLQAFDGATGPVFNAQAVADGTGRFQFDNVSLDESWRYALSVDYAGVSYSLLLDKDLPGNPVELTVYETTQDLSVIEVKRQVLVIAEVNEKEQEILAVEFVRLSNDSDRTLLPNLSDASRGRFSFLRFSLPPQATELEVQSDLGGGEIISIGTGFALTAPVFPGDHNIDFSFRFPYQGEVVSYHQNFLQGAEVFQVLFPARFSQIQVAPLQAMPAARIGESVYQVWEHRGLERGEGLTLEFTHLPRPDLLARLAESVTGETFWQVSIPSVVGATLAFLLLYSLIKRQGGTSAPASTAEHFMQEDNWVGLGRDALIREVAVLDERFQEGQLPTAEYQSQREQLKARIVAVSELPGEGQSH